MEKLASKASDAGTGEDRVLRRFGVDKSQFDLYEAGSPMEIHVPAFVERPETIFRSTGTHWQKYISTGTTSQKSARHGTPFIWMRPMFLEEALRGEITGRSGVSTKKKVHDTPAP